MRGSERWGVLMAGPNPGNRLGRVESDETSHTGLIREAHSKGMARAFALALSRP